MARIGIRSVARAVVVATPLAFSRPAHAEGESDPRLAVERGMGAESCPDGTELTSTVARLRGQAGLGRASYRVRFIRERGAFHVTILAEPSERSRTLVSHDPTCASLARATAVTLAVLFDAELAADPEAAAPAPVSPPTAPAARKVPEASDRPASARPSEVGLTLALGATFFSGVIGNAALGATGDAGIIAGGFRASIGALWIPERALSLGPGEVREHLTAGFVRLCYAPLRGNALRLDACSGALAGVLGAEASGYQRNDRSDRPWLALPLEVEGSLWTGPVGFALGVGAILPLRRDDFQVDGLGVAYASPAVGALASLRVIARVWP